MKRNWSVMRAVLEAVENDQLVDAIEEESERDRLLRSVGESPSSEDIFCGHILLAIDAGLIDGVKIQLRSGKWYYEADECIRLTMQGHDLLDALRCGKVMKKAVEMATSAAIPITADLIKEALKRLVGVA